MAQTLRPKKIDSYYCFDSLQVRFLAREVHNSPLKDTIIEGQKKEIHNLKNVLSIKDSIIFIKKQVIKNDSVSKNNLKLALSNEIKLNNAKVRHSKNKANRLKLIAILEGVLLLTIFILK